MNLVHLKQSKAGLTKILKLHPPILVIPGFSPFMFEGEKNFKVKQDGEPEIRIWKLGSILNCIYIGIVPSITLVISDCLRGVVYKDFTPSHDIDKYSNSSFNLLFSFSLANTVFVIVYLLVSIPIMINIFGKINEVSRSKDFECKLENETKDTSNDQFMMTIYDNTTPKNDEHLRNRSTKTLTQSVIQNEDE